MSPSGSDTPAIAVCRTASRHAGASFESIQAGPITSGARSVHQAWWNRAPCNLVLDDVIEIIKNKDNVSPEEARKQAIAARARDDIIVHAFSRPTFPWTAARVPPCS